MNEDVIERLLIVIGAILAVAVLGFAGLNVVSDPFGADRVWLASELENIDSRPPRAPQSEWKFGEWRAAIDAKPQVWDALIPPPPPPEPPPPPKPVPPDLNKMLQGVTAERAQIGPRAKIVHPGAERGEFLGVGDTLNGLKISAIERGFVEFSIYWKEGDETLTKRLLRN